MNIVITMAGLGTRFWEAGYTVPKYRIEAHGKSLFEWAMISLEGFYDRKNRYVFVVRREDGARPFLEERCGLMGFSSVEVVEIDRPTDGQATTALLALPYCRVEEAFLVYNIDTLVKPGAMNRSDVRGEGFLPCFSGEGDHWSFVRLDETGRAAEVREKKRISSHCTLGAYYFKTAALYEDLYRGFFAAGAGAEQGEKYIAPMYNCLIEQGGEVYISDISPRDVFVLGTPAELEVFNSRFDPLKKEFLNEAVRLRQ
jgi:NDP-sugar pyrophosphorylase family protein